MLRTKSVVFSSAIRLSSLVERRQIPVTNLDRLKALSLLQATPSVKDPRLLKIALIGSPNAGKSSLANMLAKWRVCGVSGKAHTTRSKQNVVYTDEGEGVQLIFVDLPGLITYPGRNLRLDKSFIRDPHAAIHDADVIAVVVDVAHKNSQDKLDSQIVKALHFFADKETILVLNKVDFVKKRRTRLLEMIRKLTKGEVGGRVSHLDSFYARQERRQRLAETAPNRWLTITEIVAEYLPPEAHQSAQLVLDRIAAILPSVLPEPLVNNKPAMLSAMVETSKQEEVTQPGRHVTDIDHSNIRDFFASYHPEKVQPVEEEEQQADELIEVSSREAVSTEYTESILEMLKAQLLMKSASPEEVARRKQRWHELSVKLVNVNSWNKFSDVFLVSSLTGEGVDVLRDALIKRAKPGNWCYNPQLVTDREPESLIRMAFWAHALDYLPDDLPYKVRIAVDDCEKALDAQGCEERVYVHIRIQCSCERHLNAIVGRGGSEIVNLANRIEAELNQMLGQKTVVKLSCERKGIPGFLKQKFKRASDFGEIFSL